MNLIFIEAPKELIKKPYGQEILAGDYFDEYDKKEDCKLIVKAVNNHEKLVEALDNCYNWAKNGNKEDLIVFSEAKKLLQSIEQQ